MKKSLSFMLCLMLCLIFVCTTASAASLDFYYDKESGSLSVVGVFGSTEHQPCLIYIYDDAGDESDLSDSNTPVFADMVLTGANGVLEYSKMLSSSYPSGKYRIRIVSEQDVWSEEFMYVQKQSVKNLLGEINAASSANALEMVITASVSELGIDTDVYMPVKKSVCSYVFGNKPSGGYASADAFINSFEQCMAAALIKDGNDAETILKDYSKAISIDFKDDYDKFDASVKSAIDKELKEESDYDTSLLSELYPELRAVAFMKASPTWQVLKNAFFGVDEDGNTIVSNLSAINPDLSVYNLVVNKDKVFAEMFKQRAKLTSIDKIKSVFSECAYSVYNSEQKGETSSSGGSGGGGGFGGGVSGPVTIEPGYVNQAPDTSKLSFFVDTDVNEWYYPSLEKLVIYSLINGYEDKTFKPDNFITRSEFTKLVVGVAEYTDTLVNSDAEINFDDVKTSDWFEEVVIKAAQAGLIMGTENKFHPHDLITRQDAALILYRLISSVKSLDGNSEFADSSDIADYAKNAVSALASANIISGMGNGSFAPTQNLTRAQAAKLLNGVLEILS